MNRYKVFKHESSSWAIRKPDGQLLGGSEQPLLYATFASAISTAQWHARWNDIADPKPRFPFLVHDDDEYPDSFWPPHINPPWVKYHPQPVPYEIPEVIPC